MSSDFQILVFGSAPVSFKAGTLNLQEKIFQRATLDFERDDVGVDDVWNIGVPIEAWEYGIKRFGGMVQEADLAVYAGAGGKRHWIIKCVDYNSLADRIVVGEEANNFQRSWNNVVVGQIVQEIAGYLDNDNIEHAANVSMDGDLVATAFSTDCASVSAALTELQKLASSLAGVPYVWFIDYDKALHFEPWTQHASAVTLSEDNRNVKYDSIRLTSTGEQFTTRVINKVGQLLVAQSPETFDNTTSQPLDGSVDIWDLLKVVSVAPTITLDGVPQSVGVQDVDTGKDFYWSPGSKTITATHAPGSGSTLIITYVSSEPRTIVTLGDAASRQAIEGGSGLYDLVIDSSSHPTTQQDAEQQSQAELDRRTGESHILTLDTPESEIHIGESVLFDIAAYDTDTYLVRAIRSHDEGGTFIWRSLELVKGPIIMDSVEYFRALLGSAQDTTGATGSTAPTSGAFQRTLLIKDTAIGNDVTDHIIIYLNPLQPVTVRRVSMVLRKAITSDLTVRLQFKKPDDTSGTIGTYTLPSSQPLNHAIFWTTGFTEPNLIDETVIWADITSSDGSKDVDGIASLTVEWVARGAAQITATGMAYQGTFSPSANYSKGDLVTYNGSTFLSQTDNNTGTTPGTDPTKWALVAAAGADGGVGGTGGTGGSGGGSTAGAGTFVDVPSGAITFEGGGFAPGAVVGASFGIVETPALAFAA